jgi:hypothetical protein
MGRRFESVRDIPAKRAMAVRLDERVAIEVDSYLQLVAG